MTLIFSATSFCCISFNAKIMFFYSNPKQKQQQQKNERNALYSFTHFINEFISQKSSKTFEMELAAQIFNFHDFMKMSTFDGFIFVVVTLFISYRFFNLS